MRNVVIVPTDGSENLAYPVPFGTRIIVEDGMFVEAGRELTEGYKSPADILRVNGIDAVYDYIIREVQKVYRSQSIDINDKHIEVIARQMTRKVKIDEAGDTSLLSGSTIDLSEFNAENAEVQARIDAGERDLCLATATPVLLGITKASLLTESFLSAASFQETTKVLTEAAIKGKVDHLMGLKENVIIGKLIPAGTGIERYQNVQIDGIAAPEEEAPAPAPEAPISFNDEDYDDEDIDVADEDIDDVIDLEDEPELD